jgi:DNA-binding MarR family transcriptional regulator
MAGIVTTPSVDFADTSTIARLLTCQQDRGIVYSVATTRWLDERQHHVWRSYIRMNQELYAHLEHLLATEGRVSAADYAVLVPLSEEPSGVLRARDLGVEIGWDRSRLSHHLARMERRGMVVREECEEDARGLMVRIAPAGRRAIDGAAPAHAEAVRQSFFDLLSTTELDTLSAVFDRVLDKLARDASGKDHHG